MPRLNLTEAELRAILHHVPRALTECIHRGHCEDCQRRLTLRQKAAEALGVQN